jgi:membrane protein implicated in regulation of membrane protease activity
MRTGTILVLLGLIFLFAYFGWAAFGILALSVLVFFVLAIAVVVVALWVVKRRMQRKLAELGHAVEERLRSQRAMDARGDAIDAEVVRKPRDGADDPEQLR